MKTHLTAFAAVVALVLGATPAAAMVDFDDLTAGDLLAPGLNLEYEPQGVVFEGYKGPTTGGRVVDVSGNTLLSPYSGHNVLLFNAFYTDLTEFITFRDGAVNPSIYLSTAITPGDFWFLGIDAVTRKFLSVSKTLQPSDGWVRFSLTGTFRSVTIMNTKGGIMAADDLVWALPDSALPPGDPGRAVVPEPSVWAMLMVGVSLLGAALRRRRGAATS